MEAVPANLSPRCLNVNKPVHRIDGSLYSRYRAQRVIVTVSASNYKYIRNVKMYSYKTLLQ